jgi:hypothetical protein
MSMTKLAPLWLAAAVLSQAGCEILAGGDDWVRPPETDVPAAVRAQYHEDAVRLALRHTTDEGLPAADEVEPPVPLVARYEAALLAVHRLDHPARHEVVDAWNIHTFPSPGTREILVGVSAHAAWTQAWRSGSVLTGNAPVDDLVTRYGLSLERFHDWSIGEYAQLRAGGPLNAAALAKAFDGISGVVNAEENGVVGDGNDIRASAYGNALRLDYSVGFGECPAGCISRHTWSFAVRDDGTVLFLDETGPPIR